MSKPNTPTTGCDTQCNQTPYHTFQSNNGVVALSDNLIVPAGGFANINVPLNCVILGWFQNQFSINVLNNTKPSALSKFVPLLKNPVGMPIFFNDVNIIDDSGNFGSQVLNYLEYDLGTLANNGSDKVATLFQSMQLVNQLGFLTCQYLKYNEINNNTQEQTRSINFQNTNIMGQMYTLNVVYLDFSWLYR